MQADNLFAGIPDSVPEEIVETLLALPGARLERIVSAGQATPAGRWLEQDTHEWVLLLRGRAALLLDGDPSPVTLGPGDHLRIPAGRRHRVEWTHPAETTVWLALHY